MLAVGAADTADVIDDFRNCASRCCLFDRPAPEVGAAAALDEEEEEEEDEALDRFA